MNASAQLQLPPDTGFLAEARRFVTDTLERAGTVIDTLFLVAVTEVITNAIEEHRRIGSDDPVTIDVDADAGIVRVADRGRGYVPDPTPAGEAPLAERGRGLMIARAVSEGFSWEPNEPTGTVFVLTCP